LGTTLSRVTTLISGTYVVGGGSTTHHFLQSAGTPAQMCAAVNSFWNYNSGVFHTSTSFQVQSDVVEFDDATGDIEAVVAGSTHTIAGGASGEALSPATQGLIRWRTGLYSDGREIRGRTFLPALTVASVDDGVVAATTLTVFNTMASNLVADSNTALAVWRRPRPSRPQVGQPGDRWYLPAQSAREGSSALVSSSSAWSKFATLRSRRD